MQFRLHIVVEPQQQTNNNKVGQGPAVFEADAGWKVFDFFVLWGGSGIWFTFNWALPGNEKVKFLFRCQLSGVLSGLQCYIFYFILIIFS